MEMISEVDPTSNVCTALGGNMIMNSKTDNFWCRAMVLSAAAWGQAFAMASDGSAGY